MKDLANKIGQAARASHDGEPEPEYIISDKVDMMVLLHEILVELCKVNEALKRLS